MGITHFLLDEATGKLTPTGTVTEQDSPAWLEPSPCGKFLIATHELSHHTGVPVGTGFLTSYAVNAETGALTKVCQTSTGGHGNTCCSFDRTGKFLLVTRCKSRAQRQMHKHVMLLSLTRLIAVLCVQIGKAVSQCFRGTRLTAPLAKFATHRSTPGRALTHSASQSPTHTASTATT